MAKWKMFYTVHFNEQTGQPRPTVFEKRRASCNNGVNVILQKNGKGGGGGWGMSLWALVSFQC